MGLFTLFHMCFFYSVILLFFIKLVHSNEHVEKKTKDIKDEDGDISSTRFSLITGAGISFDKLQFSASYDLGLTNVGKMEVFGSEISNKFHSFKFTVGYLF